MSNEVWKETFVEQKVTYVLEQQGKVLIVENVPARVCRETGERLFAPETVERLQQIVWAQKKPIRVVETPVFEFAYAQGHEDAVPNSSADPAPNKGMEPTR
jgi:YgiT-type zinc finger domain-containing protein